MDRLFRPIDIASLVFFRIAFGILAMTECMGLFFYYHLYERTFEPDGFQFKYYGFEWVQVFPEPYMSIFFSFITICAILIALGKWYRWVTPLFAIGFIYAFLLEKTHYLNHGYLICWLSVVMIFLPANRAFSMDVAKKPGMRRTKIPAWCVFLLAFLMGVVYFYGGLAKINPDWLQAYPMRIWLKARDDMFLLGPIWGNEITAWIMSYGGMIFDLSVAFLLIFKRTRLWAFFFVLFFHVTNAIIFNIGAFPWLSIALTLLFFPADLPRRWIAWAGKRIKLVDRLKIAWDKKVGYTPANTLPIWQESERWRRAISTGLILVAAFHLLYPLRHHLIPGNVAWTEEGHRYSWRMMLRSKYGRGNLTVKDSNTGATFVINPRDSLSRDQYYDVVSHPDMLLQYAHHLRDQYEERLGNEVEVYADIRLRLNGRKFQDYVKEDVNLAKEEWSFFKPSHWIVPFDPTRERID